MKNKKNKTKKTYVDDGHTIYSMDVDAKWSIKRTKKETIYVSNEERKTLIKGAFLAYLPRLLIVLFGFGLAIILIYFWLN